MEPDAASLAIRDNKAKSRFEIELDGEVAELEYQPMGDAIAFLNTNVPELYRRRGIGNRLVRHGLEYARAHHLRAVPICPFVKYYVNRHPEFADVVAGSW